MKFLDGTGLTKLVALIKAAIATAVQGLYTKPETGIPKTDLDSGVQESLGKADTALQSADLANYALVSETGNKIGLSMDTTTFQITAHLFDKSGTKISSSEVIDLPLESVVVEVNYVDTEEHPKSLEIVLQNGNKTYVPVGAIVTGLATQDYVNAQITAEDTSVKAWADAKFVVLEEGKGLSTNDYTDADKEKLDGIEALTEAEVEAIWNA